MYISFDRFCAATAAICRLVFLRFLKSGLLLLCVASAAYPVLSGAATPLRLLASPDLSGFHVPTRLDSSGVVTDDVRGWIYFYGAMTHINGVRISGVFRTSLDGVIDYSWLPQNLKPLTSAVIADNGDLLGLVEADENRQVPQIAVRLAYVDVVRVSQAAGPPATTTYRLPVAQFDTQFAYTSAFAASGPWIYLTLRGLQPDGSGRLTGQTHLKRFSVANQLPDTAWGRVFDGYATIVASDGGGLYLTYDSESSNLQPKWRTTVERVALAPSAAPSWTAAIERMQVPNVLIDSLGRVYVVGGRWPNIEPFPVIHRLTAAGVQDLTWAAERATSILPPRGDIRNAFLVNQRLIVTTYGGNVTPPEPPPPTLVSFDDVGNGRIVRRYDKDFRSPNAPPFNTAVFPSAGKIISIRARSLESLSPETFEALAIYDGISPGVASPPTSITREPGGATTMVGSFSVWHEGQEFKNYIRYQPNGTPDFNSRLGDNVDAAFTRLAGVSARGEAVLSGPSNPRTGAASFYVAATDTTPARQFDVGGVPSFGAVGASVADSVWIYFIEISNGNPQIIRRAAIATGVRDANWQIQLSPADSNQPDFGSAISVDQRGGIWVTYQKPAFFFCCEISKLERFSIANPTAAPYRLKPGSDAYSLPLLLNSTHAYTGQFRHHLGDSMARDTAWETPRTPKFVDDRYAYFFTFRTANGTQTESLIERAPLSGNGALDPTWQRTIPASMDMVSAYTDDQGNFFAHINAGFRIQTPSAIYTDQNLTPTAQTVVEFYSPVASRYFITGRPADQELLDQYPAIFQRTGMRFETQSATFLDTSPGLSERFQSTCRFYFGPARGGSNSHFYGTGQDCAIVNTLKSFAYEGLDFGVLRPTNGACSPAHPVGVTRLFNNRVSTNEGNHRYAVGARVTSAMVAAGWINDGVVFCATRAVEAAN